MSRANQNIAIITAAVLAGILILSQISASLTRSALESSANVPSESKYRNQNIVVFEESKDHLISVYIF